MNCIKCNCADHQDNAIYCHNCGAALYNYCTNASCTLNTQDDDAPIYIESDFCYCHLCGHESEFLQKGYIKPKENCNPK